MLICLPSVATAQRREPPTGQSIISGRAIFADNDRPVKRATVNLYTNLNHPPVRTTPANHRGEFRFTEVAAGSYFVVALAPGIIFPMSAFAMTEFGLSSYGGEEQTRVTVDGKNTSRCELRVVRAGTIRGTMTYADKEPIVSGRIVLYRRSGGLVTPFFFNETTTNDRGMYRIDGLPGGEYFIGISVGKIASATNNPRGQTGVPSAYYPGVNSLADAKPIQIQPGAEVTNINITIAEHDFRKMSGVVKWRNSEKPVPSAILTLRRKDLPQVDISLPNLLRTITPPNADRDDLMMRDLALMMMTFPTTVEALPNGQWVVEDLAPGTYIVTAYAPLEKGKQPADSNLKLDDEFDPDSLSSDSGRFVSRKVEVTIDDEDRHDIKIELSEGARVLGVVSSADGSPVEQVSIASGQENEVDFLVDSPQLSNPDGTFLLEGLSAGEVWLDAEPRGDQYVKSITLGGQDLMREPLRLTDGAEVTGVRITLGAGLATLTGRVQLKEGGGPAGSAGVLLVKSDPKLWRLRSSRVFVTADAAGVFELKCAPGEYLVFTWPAGGQPLQSVGEFVRTHAATARTIRLQSKEEKQVELALPE